MGFFDVFGKNDNGGVAQPASVPIDGPAETNGDGLSAEAPVNDPSSAAAAANTFTVDCATGWPIDVVYGYLHQDYEKKGLADAMVKSDLSFRDLHLSIIRSKILMAFKEANLSYEVMRQNLSVNVENCKGAGLMTTVAEVEKRIALIDSHLRLLKLLEADFRNDPNGTFVPLQSYSCGFMEGIATVALSGGNRRAADLPSPSVTD